MTSLNLQRRIAASLMKTGVYSVHIDPSKVNEVKSAITREDIRGLIVKGVITKTAGKGVSRGRARKVQSQRRKGRHKGAGNREGGKKARTPKKRKWINAARTQRAFLKELKEHKLISHNIFNKMYAMVKGGFFRSRSHVKLYLNEQGLFSKEVKK